MTDNVLDLPFIYNDYTINIFSDASSKPGSSKGLFCYGSIVVNKDTIIDSFYCFHDNCKCSYDAELLGLRASLYAAMNYKRRFFNKIKRINIFSDNKATILALDNYSKSKCKYIDGNYYTINSSNNIPACEPILNECAAILNELRSMDCSNDFAVYIYHQNGHILDTNKGLKQKIKSTGYNFIMNNDLDCEVSFDFILYISKYNCIVDECTGLYIKDYILRENSGSIPIATIPIKFKHPDTPKDYYIS